MEKINLYINSKNKKTTENINNLNISLPNGFLTVSRDEYFILTINSFHMFATWYNCNSLNSAYKLVSRKQDTSIFNILYFTLQQGNPNINDIIIMLNASLSGFVISSYDKLTNKIFYKRDPILTQNEASNYNLYLTPINSSSFLGIENNNEFEITFTGSYSSNSINVIAVKAINIKVGGDINFLDDTIDNYSSTLYQPNNIIFQKVVDTKRNNILSYNNEDGSNNFSHVLANNSSGQINNFLLSILDQDLNFISDISDYLLHLQFTRMKKRTSDTILLNILEYIKDLFLMIGNFIYPSKFATTQQEQQLQFLESVKPFQKYSNPY